MIKKIIAILTVGALVLAVTGCSNGKAKVKNGADSGKSESNAGVGKNGNDANVGKVEKLKLGEYTPLRVGETERESQPIGYSLDGLVNEADLIAEVTITEGLSETYYNEFLVHTYFSAKVDKTFKGEIHDTIVIGQDGNSTFTYSGDPLFKVGDRVLLFLGKIDYEKLNGRYRTEYENAFYVIGEREATFFVREYKGADYIISKFDSEITRKTEPKVSDDIKAKVIDDYFAYDPFLKEYKENNQSLLGMETVFDYDVFAEEVTSRLEDSGVKRIKDTPRRVGESIAYASLIQVTLDDAVSESDLFAELTITEWLGETSPEEDATLTFFSAKVNKTFNGNTDEKYETIILAQNGNSGMTYNRDPLFKVGDRVILFLGKIDVYKRFFGTKKGEEYEAKYENAFYSIGTLQATFFVREYEGTDYILDKLGGVGSEIKSRVDDDIKVKVSDDYFVYDPFLKEYKEYNESGGLGREMIFNYIGFTVFDYDGFVEEVKSRFENIE